MTTARAPLAQLTLGGYLHDLAGKQPVPGGGAASAVALAHGAALGSMVLHYTLGKAKFAKWEHDNAAMLVHLDQARTEALALSDLDAAAYAELNALWTLTAAERLADPRWMPAVKAATSAPAAIGDLALAVLAMLGRMPGRTSTIIRSDLAIAAEFAALAVHGAIWNVRANLPLHPTVDQAFWSAWCERASAHASSMRDRIVAACRS
ncbi:MAG: cyclodeaminase/cyclohydrolase family protein [Planctomycetes bacterium]|nr:cyclodeaminase/cyclohydrolase family protein [Planctomycetota bacterium]